MASGSRKFYDTTADQFTASRQGCDVRIGTNRFAGDLHRYRITAAIEKISADGTSCGFAAPTRVFGLKNAKAAE
jgi:hypothetical protein